MGDLLFQLVRSDVFQTNKNFAAQAAKNTWHFGSGPPWPQGMQRWQIIKVDFRIPEPKDVLILVVDKPASWERVDPTAPIGVCLKRKLWFFHMLKIRSSSFLLYLKLKVRTFLTDCTMVNHHSTTIFGEYVLTLFICFPKLYATASCSIGDSNSHPTPPKKTNSVTLTSLEGRSHPKGQGFC